MDYQKQHVNKSVLYHGQLLTLKRFGATGEPCLWITDSKQIGMPNMEFVGGRPDEYCIFLKNLTKTELAQITSLDGTPLDVEKELGDIYTEALICLRLILQRDHPEFKNWIDWLTQDIQDWIWRREVAHHLRAYGGMGSFNDLPSMRGNHDYIFCFLKSVCYAFGHLYDKRKGVSPETLPETLMEECVRDTEQESYYSSKELNQAIAHHLRQGDLQENLDRL